MSAFQPTVALGQILLVEDDDAAREMVSTALRLAGYHVRTAADGLGALRLIETLKPDVVVLDLDLPIATGFEILHELRAAPKTQRTPVIAISGHEHGLTLAKANPEFFSTMAKPFEVANLVQLVTRALRQQPR